MPDNLRRIEKLIIQFRDMIVDVEARLQEGGTAPLLELAGLSLSRAVQPNPNQEERAGGERRPLCAREMELLGKNWLRKFEAGIDVLREASQCHDRERFRVLIRQHLPRIFFAR